MAPVDLKDAYYTVPMQRDHQTFLKFEFRVAFINTLASLMASRVLHIFLHRYLSQFIQHCTIRALRAWDISYYYHFVGHCGAFCGLKWRIWRAKIYFSPLKETNKK